MGGGSAGRANNIFAFLGNAVLPRQWNIEDMLQGPCRVYEGYEGGKKDLQKNQEDEEEGSEETIGFKKRQKGQIKKKQKKSKQKI